MRDINAPLTREQVGFPKKVDCESCTSACCRAGKILKLSKAEVEYLTEKGTELSETKNIDSRKISTVVKAFAVTIGFKSDTTNYILSSDCGNLSTDELGQSSCGNYESRPEVCRIFPVGEYACRTMRFQSGIDTIDEFNFWKNYSSAHL